MFGTMGFSELIIILVIVLIIFGAGRLPQIGEGVGKALKGFKKEVQDLPPPVDPNEQSQEIHGQNSEGQPPPPQPAQSSAAQSATPPSSTNEPYKPGPELTPGTTAAMMYGGAGPTPAQSPQKPVENSPAPSPQTVPPPVTMEQRATNPAPLASRQYPPLPPSSRPKPASKRPSAVVNKAAVARVQAQQAAMKNTKGSSTPAPQDMQSLGEGLGSALRTFRDAAADVRNSIDPEMRTIQAELQAAEKEVEESIETAKQSALPKDHPQTS